MTTDEALAIKERIELLARLISGQSQPAGLPVRRLAPGRCACHEPTVKWCTRHGAPLKSRRA